MQHVLYNWGDKDDLNNSKWMSDLFIEWISNQTIESLIQSINQSLNQLVKKQINEWVIDNELMKM